MHLEIQIDRDLCIGSGNCCAVAPGVFELDLIGLAAVKQPVADSMENIVRAAEACPTRAIAVFNGGERIV